MSVERCPELLPRRGAATLKDISRLKARVPRPAQSDRNRV